MANFACIDTQKEWINLRFPKPRFIKPRKYHGLEYYGTRVYNIKTDKPIKHLYELENYFVFGCNCEHDCCGHVFAYAVAHRKNKRHYIVEQRMYYNV